VFKSFAADAINTCSGDWMVAVFPMDISSIHQDLITAEIEV